MTLGHSQAEIAEHLDISEATVSREVAKLKDEFKSQTKANISELQAAELAKLAEVESAAWLSHSKTNSEAALNTILRVIRTRASILGYDSPDVRIALQMYYEGRDMVLRALFDTFGRDSDELSRFTARLEELEAQRQSPFAAASEIVTVEQAQKSDGGTLSADAVIEKLSSSRSQKKQQTKFRKIASP